VIIDEKYGTNEIPHKSDTLKTTPKGDIQDDDSELEVVDKPKVGQGQTNHCPYDRTSKNHCVATFNSYPWVMIVSGHFHLCNFHTLNDTPKSVLVPPETQCSLASVILGDGGHLKGISLDSRNSSGIHFLFDGIPQLG
jgi:hypothetical protein